MLPIGGSIENTEIQFFRLVTDLEILIIAHILNSRYQDRRIKNTKRAHTVGEATADPTQNTAGADTANAARVIFIKSCNASSSPPRTTICRNKFTITAVKVCSDKRYIIHNLCFLVRAVIIFEVDSMSYDMLLAYCLAKLLVEIAVEVCTDTALCIIASLAKNHRGYKILGDNRSGFF